MTARRSQSCLSVLSQAVTPTARQRLDLARYDNVCTQYPAEVPRDGSARLRSKQSYRSGRVRNVANDSSSPDHNRSYVNQLSATPTCHRLASTAEALCSPNGENLIYGKSKYIDLVARFGICLQVVEFSLRIAKLHIRHGSAN